MYARLRNELLRRIRQGEWEPGSKLPTHQELCRQYGVSRITVVKALKELEADAIVTGVQGAGTFVTDLHTSERLIDMTQLFRKTFSAEGAPSRRLISIEEGTSVEWELEPFFPPEDELVRVTRVRFNDGKPVIFMQAYILREVVPPTADLKKLEDLLMHDFLKELCGLSLSRTRVYIGASQLNDEQARLLERHAGEPSLQITRVSYSLGTRPVTVSVNAHPGGPFAYYFDYDLEPPTGAQE